PAAAPMMDMAREAAPGRPRAMKKAVADDPLAAMEGEAPGGGNAPAVRTNMAETALWLPDLRFCTHGKAAFDFPGPERLTSWRLQTLALGADVQGGTGDDTIVTRKSLMVRVEIPRFFREGDRSTITAVVHNETNAAFTAEVTVGAGGAEA